MLDFAILSRIPARTWRRTSLAAALIMVTAAHGAAVADGLVPERGSVPGSAGLPLGSEIGGFRLPVDPDIRTLGPPVGSEPGIPAAGLPVDWTFLAAGLPVGTDVPAIGLRSGIWAGTRSTLAAPCTDPRTITFGARGLSPGWRAGTGVWEALPWQRPAEMTVSPSLAIRATVADRAASDAAGYGQPDAWGARPLPWLVGCRHGC